MRTVSCKKAELSLLHSLSGGQCFRWREVGAGQWRGVMAHRVWTLEQDDDHLYYAVHDGAHPTRDDARVLRDYLRLDVALDDLYSVWAERDPHFKEAGHAFPGVRILAQDPSENLFCFICSANNNLARITSMVHKLCVLYGVWLTTIDGQAYHDFPSVDALAAPAVEQTLRREGFGYRAKYIQQAAVRIRDMGGSRWFHELRRLPYLQAKEELCRLPGIGAKVADCICLMSLNHLQAIPVDTHIFKVAATTYLPHLRDCKAVTSRVYNEIGDYFRGLYGDYAGWAHTVLFCADLKVFRREDVAALPPPGGVSRRGRKRKHVADT